MAHVNISTSLEFNVLTALVAGAASAGRGLDAHIEKILTEAMPPPGPKRMSPEEVVALALARAEARPINDEFELEGLFDPAEWRTADKPKVAGRMFRTRAEARKLVVLIRRTKSRHAVYRRV